MQNDCYDPLRTHKATHGAFVQSRTFVSTPLRRCTVSRRRTVGWIGRSTGTTRHTGGRRRWPTESTICCGTAKEVCELDVKLRILQKRNTPGTHAKSGLRPIEGDGFLRGILCKSRCHRLRDSGNRTERENDTGEKEYASHSAQGEKSDTIRRFWTVSRTEYSVL